MEQHSNKDYGEKKQTQKPLNSLSSDGIGFDFRTNNPLKNRIKLFCSHSGEGFTQQ
jgi:hypothetical protein